MTEKLNKLSLPIAILIASVILGSFYYVTQINKQKSTERHQIELERIQRAHEYNKLFYPYTDRVAPDPFEELFQE